MRSIGGRQAGRVVSYHSSAGYGAVVIDGDADETEWFFHCTAIADGTREIAEGAAVSFELVAGHCGQFEAHEIRPA
ncbi:MAG: cold shock domain-containing protein [Actinomycetota bacterium]